MLPTLSEGRRMVRTKRTQIMTERTSCSSQIHGLPRRKNHESDAPKASNPPTRCVSGISSASPVTSAALKGMVTLIAPRGVVGGRSATMHGVTKICAAAEPDASTNIALSSTSTMLKPAWIKK